MSEIGAPVMMNPSGPPPPANEAGAFVPPRSWLMQVFHDTLGRTGTRIGLFWIIIVALGAIFAPILANSYPILIKMNEQWSSPMARHFTAADVTLLIAFFAAVILWFCHGIKRGTRGLILLGIVVITMVLGLIFLHPPQTNIYETYRQVQAEGNVQWVLQSPIPFSVGDHLRDASLDAPSQPWHPSAEHWLGTDIYGGDILSNMIHACRVAMAIGFISTGIAVAIGIVLGGLMGYFAGAVDLLGMRLVEMFESIPTIYLLLTLVAVFPQYRNIYLFMGIIGFTSWSGSARFVRAEFLKLRHQDFVQAAVASGLGLRSILFRHLLPNALAPLLVSASFGVASAILAETTLSFLGVGIPVGQASWGQLLNEAVSSGGSFYWWLATFPGLAIFLTVLAYNLIGEALRDALDPRMREM